MNAISSIPARLSSAAVLSGDALGWPIVALGLLGLWRVFADGAGGRLAWAIAAWAAAGGAFVLFGVLAPGRVGYERYAMEFVVRAAYAASPALLVLAGTGAAWAWRAGAPLRVAAVGSLALASYVVGRIWMGWWI